MEYTEVKRVDEQAEIANVANPAPRSREHPLLLRADSAFLLLLNQKNRDTPDAA